MADEHGRLRNISAGDSQADSRQHPRHSYFGTKRSWVQIPPPRQPKHQFRGLIRIAGRAPEWFAGILRASHLGADFEMRIPNGSRIPHASLAAACRTVSSSPEARDTDLVSIGLDSAAFTTRVISDTYEAEAAGYTDSPSFMAGGRDLFAEPGRAPGIACRGYRTSDGLAGLPGRDQLRRALLGASASND